MQYSLDFQQRTRSSARSSSGISVSFAPWNLGMTSCYRVAVSHHAFFFYLCYLYRCYRSSGLRCRMPNIMISNLMGYTETRTLQCVGRGKRHWTYRMATAQRLNVKEGKDLAALEELERGDFTYLEGAS